MPTYINQDGLEVRFGSDIGKRGFKAGVRHVDHFWCAMSSVPSVRARLGTPMRGSMEQFVIAHEEIPNYMDAMTMDFDVKDQRELQGDRRG